MSSGVPLLPAARPLGGLSASATRVLCAPVRGRAGPALPLWPACPAGGCMPRGWRGAVPWGLAFDRGEGRLVSGAARPPAARPFGQAARAPRPVFPRCGSCGRGNSLPARQGALLRDVVARCGGGGRASPGGGALRCCEGCLSAGALLPPAARPLGGLSGSPAHVPWARVCERGRTVPLACMPCWGLCAAGVVGGRPGGGWPSTIVRGVWSRALSLPCPPIPWGRQPGFRGQWFRGAVGVSVGTRHRSHSSVRSCEPSLRAVGVAQGRPRGGCLSPL